MIRIEWVSLIHWMEYTLQNGNARRAAAYNIRVYKMSKGVGVWPDEQKWSSKGFCLSGCPPLSFLIPLASHPHLLLSIWTRFSPSTSPTSFYINHHPLAVSIGTSLLLSPFFSLTYSLSLSLSTQISVYIYVHVYMHMCPLIWHSLGCNNAHMYIQCLPTYPRIYIFVDTNIDYFEWNSTSSQHLSAKSTAVFFLSISSQI